MPRTRLLSPDFWTSEAVVDCAPMTRLLLLGLGNFADDFGILPLRPRTLRLQVFPGDALDDDQMRAMIEELAARGLVRRYTVEGVEYLSIVDWAIHQRVGKRARRRYPAHPCDRDSAEAAAPPHAPNKSKPEQNPSAAASDDVADPAWRKAIAGTLRRSGVAIPDDVARHTARWRAQRRDLERDVLPAIKRAARFAAQLGRPIRLDLLDGAMTIANHGKLAA